MKSFLLRAWRIAALLIGAWMLASAPARAATFTNPLISNGADPWMQYYKGNYYLATTTWNSQLVMRKSPTIAGLKTAAPVYVWSDTTTARCCNFWAFEFHRLNGPSGWRWYMIYTAGNSANLDGQRNHVLESEGDDPMGPYKYKGSPLPGTWNIDGTYLQLNGNLYFLWSQWVGSYQTLFISKMSNPWTLTGPSVAISKSDYAWEMVGANVNEGPEVLQHGGRTFLSYSASSCTTSSYALGLLELTGSDPLAAASWKKNSKPAFASANGVYGPGHNGFFTSPDGTETWLVYHGNASASDGCGGTRSTRIQKVGWNSDGTPNFGSPAAAGTALTVPAGDSGPTTVAPAGARVQLVSRSASLCLGISGNSSSDVAGAVLRACSASSASWVLESTGDGYHRLVNANSGKALDVVNCSAADGGSVDQYAWLANSCQQWQVANSSDGWLKLTNRNSGKLLTVAGCGAAENTAVNQAGTQGNTCQEWRLQPVGTQAVVSAVSGKALDVTNCSTASGTGATAYEWLDTACQKWTFSHVDNGYYAIKPTHNPAMCLAAPSNSAGAAMAQAACGAATSQFRLLPLPDGTLRIVNHGSGLTLDVTNCALANGTLLDQYTWLDNVCQRFQLRAAD